MEKIPSDNIQKSLRYAELQLLKQQGQASAEREKEMEEILKATGLSHEELVGIATNDIASK